jgi:hypothetical protein
MHTDIGEYLVGAYLKLVEGCNVVDYNARPPGGGADGLNEFDVVAYDLDGDRVFLCEVTTHIRGLNYGSYEATIKKVRDKYERQKSYAVARLGRFKTIHYQLWSPYVPVGALTENLSAIEGLELVINGSYRQRVERLTALAQTSRHDSGNPFFRALQIIAAMRNE